MIHTDGAPAGQVVIDGMVAALAHRGPDGEGTHLDGPVALGHRRLAIIDIQGGKQPLANEDRTIWITFNGAIYNYRLLRRQLEGAGHVFRTHSDTETIVHAYEQWGRACVDHLRGMFAFAIADWRRGEVFLARDHLGIKPLYYGWAGECFAFASELQSLRCVPGIPDELDLEAIDQYLWLQYIPAPLTVFKDLRKLPPAHGMTVAFDGRTRGPEEYWRLRFSPAAGRSEGVWLEALDEVLRDSVEAHLVSDVPFGAFLSGGVDSSTVVGYMAQVLEAPVRTFSVGFEEAEFDELPYAEQAAQRWAAQHHVETVRPDALAILPQLVRHYGEPFGDSSAIPTYYVCGMARREVPMVLSGDGGDELFAGYGTHVGWMTWLSHDDKPLWRRMARAVASRAWPGRYPPRRATLEAWLNIIDYLPTEQRCRLWRPELRREGPGPPEVFRREWARAARYSLAHRAQYMDIRTYLPFDILTKVDIASMMHGLEVRTPLTDVRVAEFAATIPQALCIGRDGRGRWEGKRLLKKLLRRHFPAAFVDRPKMGFAVPVERWFAPGGAFREALQHRLLGRDCALNELFEPAEIRRLIAANATGPLWLLLFLDEWLRQHAAAPATDGRSK